MNIAEVEKVTRKTCGCGQYRHVGGDSIRERSRLLTVKFMSSVVGDCQVPETLSSCDIDDRALKRTGTFASERKGKLLCSFKQGCCDVSFLTLICVNKYFETEKM